MFNFLTLATVALSAVSAANGLAIPALHRRVTKPVTYLESVLEPYGVYHARYMALDCLSKHNTTFFSDCCHPLLASETLEKNRPAKCNPANLAASSSALSALPSTTQGPDDDLPFCDDDGDESSAVPSSTPISTHVNSLPVATPTPVALPATSVHVSSAKPLPTHIPSSEPSKPSSTASPTKASPSLTPAKASSGGSLNSGGFATFFDQNGVAGACGKVHSDNDLIAAIDQARYGDSGKQSSLCGQQVQITNTKNGKSVTVTIADDCPTCVNGNSIDLSRGAFTRIATEEEGMVPIQWQFL